ncbi:MAG: hypothetical protein JKX84_02710 [Flavobacteriales bacterium]|nr:hypothetical protein [Flavobacteriales bacterium]
MKIKAITYTILSVFTCSIVGCNEVDETVGQTNKTREYREDGWKLEKQVTKEIDNLSFTFPSEGYAYDNRDLYVKECIDALKEDCAIIKLPNNNDPIKIRFLNSRKEMEEEVGMSVSGFTNMWTQEIHIVANNEFTPPIKHEIMHMISMTTWGYPHDDLIWINEGLATYAHVPSSAFAPGYDCNGYNVGQIYRYFLEKEMLISIDSLTNSFYREDDMISYHQSAHIVEFLLTNYGIEKFQNLWKNGFSFFEEIYNISFAQIEIEMNKKAIKKYPTAVNIDWNAFKEGCK